MRAIGESGDERLAHGIVEQGRHACGALALVAFGRGGTRLEEHASELDRVSDELHVADCASGRLEDRERRIDAALVRRGHERS